MTFSRQNLIGWALFEELSSAQMNGIDLNLTKALDAEQGGTFAFVSGVRGTGNLIWDFSAVPLDGAVLGQFEIKSGAQPAGLYLNGDASDPGSIGLLAVADGSSGLTDNAGREGIVSAGYGSNGVGVRGLGGDVSGALAGAGLGGTGGDFIGGGVTAGDRDGDGGTGVTGEGGETTSTSLLSQAGPGGVFIGARGQDISGRIPGFGVSGEGGLSLDTPGGAGGVFLGGVSISDTSGAGLISTGGAGNGTGAGAGGVFLGGAATGAVAPDGVVATGGDTSGGVFGGFGLTAIGGEGTGSGGVGIIAFAGDVAGSISAAIAAVASNDGEALNLQGLNATPARPLVVMDQSIVPSVEVAGGVYFDSTAERLAMLNGDIIITGGVTSASEYEPVAAVASGTNLTGGDAPILRATIRRTGGGGFEILSSRSLQPFTAAISGTTTLQITFGTALASAFYVAVCSQSAYAGVNSHRWSFVSASTTVASFQLFAAGSAVAEDITVTEFCISVAIYAPEA